MTSRHDFLAFFFYFGKIKKKICHPSCKNSFFSEILFKRNSPGIKKFHSIDWHFRNDKENTKKSKIARVKLRNLIYFLLSYFLHASIFFLFLLLLFACMEIWFALQIKFWKVFLKVVIEMGGGGKRESGGVGAGVVPSLTENFSSKEELERNFLLLRLHLFIHNIGIIHSYIHK